MCETGNLSVRVRLFLLLILLPTLALAQPAAHGRTNAFECGRVDVVIVSDMGFFGDADGARVKLMKTFDKAKAFFEYSFNIELKMYVRDIILPTNENPFPDPQSNVSNMYDLMFPMKEWLADNNHDVRKYDIVLGVTQTTYNVPYWGYCFAENEILASIVMQYKDDGGDLVVRLMAHELGHAFGAGHDPAGTSLMSPAIDGGGSWSAQNKQDVNAFIAQEKVNKYFGVCPTLSLESDVEGMNVTFNWTVNYERDVTSYVLYEDGVAIDTIQAKGASDDPVTYTHEYSSKKEGEVVYWLHQMSKWGTVLENENAVVTIGNPEVLVFDGYPNPFMDSLRVMPVEPGTKVFIYNSMGQHVAENIAMEKTITLHTSNWAPGLYFISNAGKIRRVVRRQ